ncbi:MAG: hypothetical protein U5L07_00275 [Desulfobacterales bacterium]|nr:hypothetical protein [Desulfobacterales bacterium]
MKRKFSPIITVACPGKEPGSGFSGLIQTALSKRMQETFGNGRADDNKFNWCRNENPEISNDPEIRKDTDPGNGFRFGAEPRDEEQTAWD